MTANNQEKIALARRTAKLLLACDWEENTDMGIADALHLATLVLEITDGDGDDG